MAETPSDIEATQALRHLAFAVAPVSNGLDQDCFDLICSHIMLEDRESGQLVCSFRLLPLAHGAEIDRSYSAQYYELSALRGFKGPMAEIGRFCMHPDWHDPDILRVAWGAMTRYVDENNVEMLFGCSSFKGVEADGYTDAFAMLKERHLAPVRWLPRVKAPLVIRFAQTLNRIKPNAKKAMQAMPPLLRTYLMMGGWVSDHAVVDQQMNTLHVFTGLEISAIPAERKRLLRAVAQ